MANGQTAYLVIRRDDGFGDVFQLRAGQRCTIGRATSNRVVLKDEMCSREHAEVLFADHRWYLRDLGSLNGTRVNTRSVRDEVPLTPQDVVELGNTQLVFVDSMQQLPDIPRKLPATADSKLEIRVRLSETHFGPDPSDRTVVTTTHAAPIPPVEGHLARLYRLALAMGASEQQDELVELVLDGLMDLVKAEVGAVLFLGEDNELALQKHRHRDGQFPKYQKVSQYVSNEVLTSRQAILAEDVSQDRHLRIRESLTDLQVSSLICTPVQFRGQMYGLVHLYCLDPTKALDGDDLDLSLAVANQFAMALFQLQRRARMEASNRLMRDQLKVESKLVGSSEALKKIETQIGRVAETNATVLIRGESGVGKELVARAIHENSQRRDGPFVTINCAALTESLLESELFGHEKGAFTGATERMAGKFESASQGTIFLDEIGEMAPNTQAKFLRVLEGHTFERVGGNQPIRVDVRVVAATNRPLEDAVRAGKFRRDLFFRLQVVEMQVPPLRERRGDIPILAEHFLTKFVKETGRKLKGFTGDALQKLNTYHWPGNVRELRNVIERAVALAVGPHLDSSDIWLSSLEANVPTAPAASDTFVPVSLEEMEKRYILRTLQFTQWNKSQSASILGIERSTLDRKIKAYELKRE
jgi:Nif-specific regulatory protein